MKNFVTYVEIERRKRGLTQIDLSKLVGISPSRISLIEQGKSVPKPAEMDTLSQVLGIKRLI